MASYNITDETTDMANLSTNIETTPNNDTSHIRDEDLAKMEILFLCLIFCLATFGNGFVLLVLGVRKKKLTRMNILIVHLTVADLFVAFFNILPQLIWDITYRFHGNDFLCRSVKYLQVVAMYASAYVLVTTALDRYLVICHPLTIQTWSTLRVHLLVLVAWVFSLLFSVPQLFIFSYRQVAPGVYDCWGEFEPLWTLQLYITWITCAIYVIPAVLLVILYGNICLTVYRSMMGREAGGFGGTTMTRHVSSNKGALYHRVSKDIPSRLSVTDCRSSTNPRAHTRVVSRSKVKTVKLTLTVVACYLLCWGPFFVAQMWAAWDANAPFNNQAMVIILLMSSLNSCTNPWIYMAFSDNICMRLAKWKQESRSESDSRLKMTLLCSDSVHGNRPGGGGPGTIRGPLGSRNVRDNVTNVRIAGVRLGGSGKLKQSQENGLKGEELALVSMTVMKRQSVISIKEKDEHSEPEAL